MARYDYTIEHVPGKLLHKADVLSRAPTSEKDPTDTTDLQYVADAYIDSVIKPTFDI